MDSAEARKIFYIGQRVKLSPKGLYDLGHFNGYTKDMTGVVHGWSRKSDCIRIRREQLKFPQLYHMSYWEAANA